MQVSEANYKTIAGHTSPRKNVLLLSCMDLRLLDNLVAFMNFENLENRYDQFILAGAAAGAMVMPSWRKAFFDHMVLAVGLHQIKYVYIVEHRDCGAYEEFFHKSYVHYDEIEGHNCYHLEEEHKDHTQQAFMLKAEIDKYCLARRQDPFPPDDDPISKPFRDIISRSHGEHPDPESLKKLWNIEVRCYMMDLRGGVIWLDEFDDSTEEQEYEDHHHEHGDNVPKPSVKKPRSKRIV